VRAGTRGDLAGMNWRAPLLAGMVEFHPVPPSARSRKCTWCWRREFSLRF